MNDLSHTHMRAAVWHGRNDIRVEQVPLPADPAPGWVQIKVDWCGICGSDLHEYVAGPVFIPVEAPHPLTGIQGQCILGHEFCGEIHEVGAGVSGYRPGDRVVTSGDGAMLPAGLLVGQVVMGTDRRLRVVLSADYERLEFLRVLRSHDLQPITDPGARVT